MHENGSYNLRMVIISRNGRMALAINITFYFLKSTHTSELWSKHGKMLSSVNSMWVGIYMNIIFTSVYLKYFTISKTFLKKKNPCSDGNKINIII